MRDLLAMLRLKAGRPRHEPSGLHLAFGSIVEGQRKETGATDKYSVSEQSPVERSRHCAAACSIDRFYPRANHAAVEICLSSERRLHLGHGKPATNAFLSTRQLDDSLR